MADAPAPAPAHSSTPAPGSAAACVTAGDSRPALAPHVRLREDRARGRWVLLAPERMLVPDEIALDILRRLDGRRTLDEHVAALAAEYGAPENDIRPDVVDLLRSLAERGFVVA